MNNCKYVRDTYGVPASIGGRVVYKGRKGIISADRGNYIGITFDDQKPGVINNFHPSTVGLIYLGRGIVRKNTKCSECIYQKYCKLQYKAEKCTMMFIQKPKDTELLRTLKTAIVYKVVAVMDNRTHDLCRCDDGLELSAKEVIGRLPHVDLGNPKFRCRCVLEALKWETDEETV